MTTPTACAACGITGSGRFCSSCGAMLGGSTCPECATPMSPGARFCHRCGASSTGRAAVARPSTDTAVPWAVAAIAMVALVALVAGRRFGGDGNAPEARPLSASTNDGVVRAPDISQMTPAQRAESLLDRMNRLSAAGHVDSVRFFAPMAIASYQLIESITDEQRYDFGRVGILAGSKEISRAQADTLLSRNPGHLLGLTLALSSALADGDTVAVRTLRKKLLTARTAWGSAISSRHNEQIEAAIQQANQ